MIKMLETERVYRCSKCDRQFPVQADVEQYFAIPRPTHCASEACDSSKFAMVHQDVGTCTSIIRWYL